MDISTIKVYFCTAVGIIGGGIARLFGGWTEDIATLVIFMAIDFCMGLVVAGVFHKSNKSESGALNSRAGWKGLCKKCVTLVFVLLAHRLDMLLETDYIRTAAIIGFISNEAISIVENAGLMGVPLPSVVTKAIELLKRRVGEDEDEDI